MAAAAATLEEVAGRNEAEAGPRLLTTLATRWELTSFTGTRALWLTMLPLLKSLMLLMFMPESMALVAVASLPPPRPLPPTDDVFGTDPKACE